MGEVSCRGHSPAFTDKRNIRFSWLTWLLLTTAIGLLSYQTNTLAEDGGDAGGNLVAADTTTTAVNLMINTTSVAPINSTTLADNITAINATSQPNNTENVQSASSVSSNISLLTTTLPVNSSVDVPVQPQSPGQPDTATRNVSIASALSVTALSEATLPVVNSGQGNILQNRGDETTQRQLPGSSNHNSGSASNISDNKETFWEKYSRVILVCGSIVAVAVIGLIAAGLSGLCTGRKTARVSVDTKGGGFLKGDGYDVTPVECSPVEIRSYRYF